MGGMVLGGSRGPHLSGGGGEDRGGEGSMGGCGPTLLRYSFSARQQRLQIARLYSPARHSTTLL